jgi:hypothetical protein
MRIPQVLQISISSSIEEIENDDETLLKCTHSCPYKINNTPGFQICDIQNPDKQVTPEYTTENITSIVQDDLPKINSEKRTKEIRSNDFGNMNHLLAWVGVHTFVLRFYLFVLARSLLVSSLETYV